jgi:hypothetical protein
MPNVSLRGFIVISAPKVFVGFVVMLLFGGALLFVAEPSASLVPRPSGQGPVLRGEGPSRTETAEIEWCATFADSAAKTAQLIDQEFAATGARNSHRGVTVFSAPGNAEEKSRIAAAEVKKALTRRKVHLNERTGWPVEIAAIESENGSAIECTILSSREKRRVAYGGPSNLGAPLSQSRSDLLLSMKTSMAWSEGDSREDALDLLRTKIVQHAFEHVEKSGELKSSDRQRFTDDFKRRYSRELLIAQGDYRISTSKIDSPDGDRYDSYLVWRAPRGQIGDLAETTAKAINFEKRLPFIRIGLAIGSLILAILAWLRLDWWLKGHHSFLTKAVCGILWAITVGLIWSWPNHG